MTVNDINSLESIHYKKTDIYQTDRYIELFGLKRYF